MGFERWIHTLPLRLRSLVRRGSVERELDEELRYHVEQQIEENVAKGMTPDEARYAALRAMGGVEQHKETCRDTRRVRVFEEVAQDVRFGLRGLAKHRGFSIVAVLTLALGIGANTAVFSVINAVFLQPLAYRDSDRLVAVFEDATSVGYPHNNFAPGNFADVRAHNTVFEDVAAVVPTDVSLTGDGEPERLSALGVTGNLLSVLGTGPEFGRDFLPEEDQSGGPLAVIISHGLMERRYGAAANVLGRQIFLNGESFTVVGVMPSRFQVLDRHADAWLPVAFPPEVWTNRRSHILDVVGRLKPGVTAGQAQAEVQAMMEQIGRAYPDQPDGLGGAVVPLREQIAGDTRKPLAVLMIAVALVLLIACINVGNLMLSRAAVRNREIALRAALGAGRWRITRQLLTENIPLVVLGTGLGLALAYASLAFLRQLIPPGLTQSAELGIDVRVLVFTLLIALAASVLFGIAPALQAPKVDLNDVLRQGSARSGHTGGRLQSVLVVGEVGLAIALLVAASLLIQTFFLLRGQYTELRTASVLTMKTVLSKRAYDTHARRAAFLEQVLQRVRALPGVDAAGYTNALPLDYKGDSTSFNAEGHAPDRRGGNNANIRNVTPDCLKALGVPLREGRYFADTDGPTGQPVAIVNETMARRYWPGEDVLGKRFKIGDPEDDTPWATIVGIVGDVRQNGVDVPTYAEMYFPYEQCDYVEWAAPRSLVIRTSGDQAALTAAVRREIAAVDPNQPVSDVKTMTDILGSELSARRLGMQLLGAFAAVALLLASIGIYGLLAQRVAQMTHEIGVRLALGAEPRTVVALIVGRGMKLVLLGSVVGLALSFALTRLMASLLFGVGASDPLTLVGVPVLLAAVAFVACYVPARRASRVDATVALRYE